MWRERGCERRARRQQRSAVHAPLQRAAPAEQAARSLLHRLIAEVRNNAAQVSDAWPQPGARLAGVPVRRGGQLEQARQQRLGHAGGFAQARQHGGKPGTVGPVQRGARSLGGRDASQCRLQRGLRLRLVAVVGLKLTQAGGDLVRGVALHRRVGLVGRSVHGSRRARLDAPPRFDSAARARSRSRRRGHAAAKQRASTCHQQW